MTGPLDPENMTEQQQRTYREVMAIRERNADRVAKIERMGVALDFSTARVEHLISALIECGVLTVDQVLQIHKNWELEMKQQTKQIYADVEERIRAARAEATRPKLVIPGRG